MLAPVLCPNPTCGHLLCKRDGDVYVLSVRTRKGGGPKRVVIGQFARIQCEKCGAWWDASTKQAQAA